jgi:hypothetical protein
MSIFEPNVYTNFNNQYHRLFQLLDPKDTHGNTYHVGNFLQLAYQTIEYKIYQIKINQGDKQYGSSNKSITDEDLKQYVDASNNTSFKFFKELKEFRNLICHRLDIEIYFETYGDKTYYFEPGTNNKIPFTIHDIYNKTWALLQLITPIQRGEIYLFSITDDIKWRNDIKCQYEYQNKDMIYKFFNVNQDYYTNESLAISIDSSLRNISKFTHVIFSNIYDITSITAIKREKTIATYKQIQLLINSRQSPVLVENMFMSNDMGISDNKNKKIYLKNIKNLAEGHITVSLFIDNTMKLGKKLHLLYMLNLTKKNKSVYHKLKEYCKLPKNKNDLVTFMSYYIDKHYATRAGLLELFQLYFDNVNEVDDKLKNLWDLKINNHVLKCQILKCLFNFLKETYDYKFSNYEKLMSLFSDYKYAKILIIKDMLQPTVHQKMHQYYQNLIQQVLQYMYTGYDIEKYIKILKIIMDKNLIDYGKMTPLNILPKYIIQDKSPKKGEKYLEIITILLNNKVVRNKLSFKFLKDSKVHLSFMEANVQKLHPTEEHKN